MVANVSRWTFSPVWGLDPTSLENEPIMVLTPQWGWLFPDLDGSQLREDADIISAIFADCMGLYVSVVNGSYHVSFLYHHHMKQALNDDPSGSIIDVNGIIYDVTWLNLPEKEKEPK